ncbi:MAG TPA: phosphoribosyltransferase [Anaerolineaceae bacterium]
MARFEDRTEAGLLLARELAEYTNRPEVVVLALPRGGVMVGAEVALALHAPLDVLLVRKLGVPGQEELAMGAIASGGIRIVNDDILGELQISRAVLEEVTRAEQAELVRREAAYRENHPPLPLAGKTVLLIDDGLATGASMYAAIQAVRERRPRRIVVAVPVAAPESCRFFSALVDQMVCMMTPTQFHGVGAWYEDFSQVSDETVKNLLARARAESSPRSEANPPAAP